MTVSVQHPLSETVHSAAHGSFPPADGRAVVLGPMSGPCDMIAFFAGHVEVAADVPQEWVDENLSVTPSGNPANVTGGIFGFVQKLAERLGNPPTYSSLLTSASHRSGYLHGEVEEGGEPEPGWAAYRENVSCFRYKGTGSAGRFALAHGPGGRWDVHIRVDQGGGGRVGRELLSAAKVCVPDRSMLFGSAPLHDSRVLRTLLASGFEPICTEVLFLTRPSR